MDHLNTFVCVAAAERKVGGSHFFLLEPSQGVGASEEAPVIAATRADLRQRSVHPGQQRQADPVRGSGQETQTRTYRSHLPAGIPRRR